MERTSILGLLLALSGLIAACASRPVTETAATRARPVDTRSRCELSEPRECAAAGRGLLWYRTAAERQALYAQAYRFAGERIAERSAGHAAGTWAVVMDADETVLDNSGFRLDLVRRGQPFTADAWTAWVREKRATLQPGADQFVSRVLELGGMVVIVTNRDEAVCPETRENLASLGIVVRGVLCAVGGVYDKNPRFASLRDGTSPLGLAPVDVLMFVGDNIHDFPGRSQTAPQPWASFGDAFIVMPNPMYGSWTTNSMH